MNFTDLNIKPSYDSDEDDILNEFYIPVLKESVRYCRLAGFFSSSSLAIAARGITGLLKNNGKMEIVAGAMLDRRDIEAIKNRIEKPEEIIEKLAIQDIESITDEFVENHIKALGWLVANNKVEIKIAIVRDKNGIPLDVNSILSNGIFHQKVGLLTDKDGNSISFSGSVNETARAWGDNIEELKVFRNWIKQELDHFNSDLKKFDKYWNNKSNRVDIIDAPRAIQNKLIKIAPKNFNELKLELEKTLSPWPHQKKAIVNLKKSFYNGILKMATGTGKTFTALLVLRQYFQDIKTKGNRILVVVPQHVLVAQWKGDINEFSEHNDFVLTYDSKTPANEKKLIRKVWKLSKEEINKQNIYLIITIDSISSFLPFNNIQPDFLIGDEVHTYGTENRMSILENSLSKVKFRIGLSATPERYYDIEGTDRIFNWFSPVVFKYNIKDAQQDSVLTNYNYYLSTVKLTQDEENELKILTKQIAQKVAQDFKCVISEKEKVLPAKVTSLLNRRSRIIKRASNKLSALREILEKNHHMLKQCIVYCEDTNQLNAVQEVFDELGIHTYIKYHSNIKTRDEALNLFKDKNCNFILSMHCLDQGVNIPSCESLILLSSSGNPREYIQRRGRVLRNPKNKIKPVVKIYDILAFPNEPNESYKGVVMTQLIRAWEFIRCSQSPEAKMVLDEVMDTYIIYNHELDKIIEEW